MGKYSTLPNASLLLLSNHATPEVSTIKYMLLNLSPYSRHSLWPSLVFTFGIGADSSEELVRGMAEAGNGLHELIGSNNLMMEAKSIGFFLLGRTRAAKLVMLTFIFLVMRQFERILLPAIIDSHIDWGAAVVHKATATQTQPLFSGDLRPVYAFISMASY